jgi:hypothetical protein
MCFSPWTNLIAWLMYNDLGPLHPTDFKTFCRLCQGTSRLMGTFPTHNNERERKVEGILGFLYPCPHKAKFLLFSSTHNRSNKFRITKFPTAQACLYLKYTTIKCLTHVYFKYRLLMFYSTVSDSYLIVRPTYCKKPYFHW